MSNKETEYTLDIAIDVTRTVEWSMDETVTFTGTREECEAEIKRIEGLEANELIKLIAEHKKSPCPDTFLYDDKNWGYTTEDYACTYLRCDLPKEDICA
jgi:hypothetical protein